MPISLEMIGRATGALGVAFLVALILTPVVKTLAVKMGAIDDPKRDEEPERRMHSRPIPRMGGLAIFLGFLLSTLVFIPLEPSVRRMLLGAVIIVVLGIFDDIYSLRARFKLVVQILAALVVVLGKDGIAIETLSNPNIFSPDPYWELGWLSIPVTVMWIVGMTNAVNLIDGLDGLACGVSSISSLTLLVIALMLEEPTVAILVAALAGGCLGFLPYNLNPAKIFMGDTGATFLGFVLAWISIQGLFKMYTLISFVVPFLLFGLPIFDTCFAFVRRIAHGQSPMHADRSHVHHRLIDMGFSQKQAVAVLYVITAILGLSAVVLTTSGAVKAMLLLFALFAAGAVALSVFQSTHHNHPRRHREEPHEPPSRPDPQDERDEAEVWDVEKEEENYDE